MNDPKTPGKLSKVFRDPPAKRNTSKSASGRGKKKKKARFAVAFLSLSAQQSTTICSCGNFYCLFHKLSDIVLEYIYT